MSRPILSQNIAIQEGLTESLGLDIPLQEKDVSALMMHFSLDEETARNVRHHGYTRPHIDNLASEYGVRPLEMIELLRHYGEPLLKTLRAFGYPMEDLFVSSVVSGGNGTMFVIPPALQGEPIDELALRFEENLLPIRDGEVYLVLDTMMPDGAQCLLDRLPSMGHPGKIGYSGVPRGICDDEHTTHLFSRLDRFD